MAKNPIKVSASAFSDDIYAGRVNEKTQMFVGEKEVVTDSAVSAVAQFLLRAKQELHFKHHDIEYILSVSRKSQEGE